jgi:uncharacterized protein YndB with AHSA1/START domain
MPIKKDETGKRWVEMEFVAPGTPEHVWQAMATGAGNTAWFTKATVEERVGGEIQFDFGTNGASTGEVTDWEPPRRLGYVERHWAEGAPPVATEITITARSGDTCVVRMVHSLFTSSDEWDDQMEGFEKGWPAFFAVLRLYLTHFSGQPAASFAVMNGLDGDHLAAWTQLTTRLGLDGVSAGETRTTAPDPELLTGVVERIEQDRQQRYIVMRLESPAPGVMLIGTYDFGPQIQASMSMYLYGRDAKDRAAASGQRWREWFTAIGTAARRSA